MKLAPVVIIGAVLGALLGLAMIVAPVLPPVGSTQAENTDRLYFVMLIIMGVVFGVVTAVLVVALLRFRARRGETHDGSPVHGVTWLEVVWTVIPAVIVIALTAYSWIILNDNEAEGATSMEGKRLEVTVVGYQWNWAYYLPEEGVVEEVLSDSDSDELLLPVNVPVRFTLKSRDVIHGWWVPDFRVQMNTVPGNETYIYATPTRLGEVEVVCTFICGLQHPQMGSEVENANPRRIRVVEQAEFDAWVAERAALVKKTADDLAANPNGKAIATFNANGCGGCHAWGPAGSAGVAGPGLDGIAASAKGAGLDTADYVRQSIVEPGAVVAEGFQPVMPADYASKISEEDIETLVTAIAGGAK